MDSCLRWLGGKSLLCKRIVNYFPKHVCYVEPFCGALWVLLAKSKSVSKHEVINDNMGELVNFWKVVRDESELLYESVKWDMPSRQMYNEFRELSKRDNFLEIDRVERARIFYWMVKCAFGGIYMGAFGTGLDSVNTKCFSRFTEMLFSLNRRIKKVTIENMDYRNLSKTYDSSATLWYVDPPYFSLDYSSKSRGYSSLDYNEFIEFVLGLKGKVCISHNVCDDLKRDLPGWNIVNIGARPNKISKKASEPSYEWLIMNYDPPSQTMDMFNGD